MQALRRALPDEDFIYLGDTARVPYGSKPPDMVRQFAREIADVLVTRGVKGVVVACNTASALSLPELADTLPVPVWGVLEPGVRAAYRAVPQGRVGIIGTWATVRSRAYQQRLEPLGLRTWAKACPLFVPLVEEGVSDTAIARLVASHYLAERPDLDALILGCTHYPALKTILQEVLPDVVLVDSAAETAAVVAHDLSTLGLVRTPHSRAGTVHHLVSGDLANYRHTARRLGGPAGGLERIDLSSPATSHSVIID